MEFKFNIKNLEHKTENFTASCMYVIFRTAMLIFIKIYTNFAYVQGDFFMNVNLVLCRWIIKNKIGKRVAPTPGIEPGPSGWKPEILTTRPHGMLHNKLILNNLMYDSTFVNLFTCIFWWFYSFQMRQFVQWKQQSKFSEI